MIAGSKTDFKRELVSYRARRGVFRVGKFDTERTFERRPR